MAMPVFLRPVGIPCPGVLSLESKPAAFDWSTPSAGDFDGGEVAPIGDGCRRLSLYSIRYLYCLIGYKLLTLTLPLLYISVWRRRNAAVARCCFSAVPRHCFFAVGASSLDRGSIRCTPSLFVILYCLFQSYCFSLQVLAVDYSLFLSQVPVLWQRGAGTSWLFTAKAAAFEVASPAPVLSSASVQEILPRR